MSPCIILTKCRKYSAINLPIFIRKNNFIDPPPIKIIGVCCTPT